MKLLSIEDKSRVMKKALIIGLVVMGVCAGFGFKNPNVFFEAYLLAFLFTVSFPLGAMAVSLVHHLTHGAWGFVIRRPALSAIKTLPFMALLFLPIFLGMEHLYMWANPEIVAHDHLIQKKAAYLNVPFFQARFVLYFVIWLVVSRITERKSSELLADKSDYARTRLQLVSGLSLLAFVFAGTFAAFDWGMSTEPHWFSTIYGIFSIISQALLALCFMILITKWSQEKDDNPDKLQRFHDLGNLSLALVMLWAYMAFSQFFIIWSGNLPEEIIWYLPRLKNGWQWVGIILIAFHFFVPFFLLLNRVIKRSVALLSMIAAFILVMRFVDLTWILLPTYQESLASIHWLHILLPFGMASLWFGLFLKEFKKHP